MPSKIRVDELEGSSGSTITVPSGQTLTLTDATVNLPSTALSALNASNLTSGTVPSARLSLSSSDLPTVPTTKGGTGLTTIGTANQVLKVNSGASGLEFGSIPSDLVNDATPQLGGNLDVQTHSIVSTGNNNVKIYPSGSGVLEVGGATNSGRIQLNCENNSHGIKLASPPHSAGQSYTLTFPSTAPVAGKVLQTDASGNLSFENVSSDFVKLAETTASSSASVSFDGYFSNTYENYKVIFNSVKASTPQFFRIRFRQSNADATSSLYSGGFIYQSQVYIDGYYLDLGYRYLNFFSSGSGVNSISPASSNNSEYSDFRVNTTTYTSVNGEIFLFNPLSTSNFKYCNTELCFRATGGGVNFSLMYFKGFQVYESELALSGISFFPSTGTFTSGTFKLYGIK
jgi:hypothetical protein